MAGDVFGPHRALVTAVLPPLHGSSPVTAVATLLEGQRVRLDAGDGDVMDIAAPPLAMAMPVAGGRGGGVCGPVAGRRDVWWWLPHPLVPPVTLLVPGSSSWGADAWASAVGGLSLPSLQCAELWLVGITPFGTAAVWRAVFAPPCSDPPPRRTASAGGGHPTVARAHTLAVPLQPWSALAAAGIIPPHVAADVSLDATAAWPSAEGHEHDDEDVVTAVLERSRLQQQEADDSRRSRPPSSSTLGHAVVAPLAPWMPADLPDVIARALGEDDTHEMTSPEEAGGEDGAGVGNGGGTPRVRRALLHDAPRLTSGGAFIATPWWRGALAADAEPPALHPRPGRHAAGAVAAAPGTLLLVSRWGVRVVTRAHGVEEGTSAASTAACAGVATLHFVAADVMHPGVTHAGVSLADGRVQWWPGSQLAATVPCAPAATADVAAALAAALQPAVQLLAAVLSRGQATARSDVVARAWLGGAAMAGAAPGAGDAASDVAWRAACEGVPPGVAAACMVETALRGVLPAPRRGDGGWLWPALLAHDQWVSHGEGEDAPLRELAALCAWARGGCSGEPPRGCSEPELRALRRWAAGEGDSPAGQSRLISLLPRLSGSHGLGVLVGQGVTGRPVSEVALASHAYTAVINAATGAGDHAAGAPLADDQDGLDWVAQAAPPGRRDRRLQSAARMLRTSRPHAVPHRRGGDTGEHAVLAAQQQHLLYMARRHLGAAAGRAALTSGCALGNVSFPLRVPVLTLACRMAPAGGLTRLDVSGVASVTMGILDMAETWNGMAAGLRVVLPPAVEAEPARVAAWIRSHRYSGVPPDMAALATTTAAISAGLGNRVPAGAATGAAAGLVPPNPAHAGLLFAFGLRGWLRSLSPVDWLDYLSHGHGLTTACMLLGGAVGAAGTQHLPTTKAALLHLPSILPGSHHDDVDVPVLVQNCAILALGWLHAGTGHPTLSACCLRELSSGSHMDAIDDRESFLLCAGFAAGLLHVGSGLPPSARATLVRLFEGGPDEAGVAARQAYVVGEGRVFATASAARRAAPPASSQRPVLYLEGRRVNVAVTAAGAVAALGLACAGTADAALAARLALPDSLGQLDGVRYDAAAMRIVARSLVLPSELDAVAAACAEADAAARAPAASLCQRAAAERRARDAVRRWVAAQVPAVLRRVMRRVWAVGLEQGSGGMAAAVMAMVMAGVAGGHEPSATSAPPASGPGGPAPECDDPAARLVRVGSAWVDERDGPLADIDVAQVKMLYAAAVSGACASLAVRFAGARSAVLRDELLEHATFFACCRGAGDKDWYAGLTSAMMAQAHVATCAAVATGQALFAELSAAGQADDAAVAHTNALLFGSDVDSPAAAAAALVTAAPSPPLPFPLRLSRAGAAPVVSPARLTRPQRKSRRSLPVGVAAACGSEPAAVAMALNCTLVALGIVMAGSCDLAGMRLLRALSRRVDRPTTYGDHLATHLALGMLCLGSGHRTLSADTRLRQAALWGCMLPQWPPGSASSLFWPQLARMLWPVAEVPAAPAAPVNAVRQPPAPTRADSESATAWEVAFLAAV
jgi:hypothetical protein